MSPSRMTDEPAAPRTSGRSDDLRLHVVIDGGRALEHDHRVGERVVAVRGGEVDDLEVGRDLAQQLERPRRSLVVERHERVVEDQRRPPVTGDEPERVDIDLRFEKPFPADNRIELALTPTGERSTVVEWRMHGELGGVMRAFSLVRSMDSMVGPDFEKGLARLKRAAEAGD